MSAAARALLKRLGVALPIIQAPMAGVSTPRMAAAVTAAGGLGSIGIGAASVDTARQMIRAARAAMHTALNVNVFCHRPATTRVDVERAWIERLRPQFEKYDATPPMELKEIYTSFVEDDDMLAMLLAEKPRVVSFHFGLPDAQRMRVLRDAGITLIGSATTLAEARQLVDAGIDAIVAQGYEAGGHRGVFDTDAHDDRLGTFTLTRLLVKHCDVPIIAAGGIMDGAGIAAALRLGAAAAQLGTAFVGCDESSADEGYRRALFSDAAQHTVMTRAVSGRPARCLSNRFTQFGDGLPNDTIPDYPIAYDAGKALHAAAKAQGEFGFGAQWAGQGAPLCRRLSAGALVATLSDEMR